MNKYHKIQTVFKRDPKTNMKTLLDGEYSILEFEYLKDNEWVFTEKVDGTNIRILFRCEAVKPYIEIKGKSDNAQIPVLLNERLTELFSPKIQLFKELFDCDVCLYGEGYGNKINKGKKYTENHDFVLFDIKIGDWWLKREDIEEIAIKLNIDIVPVIGQGTLQEAIEITKNGFDSQWGSFIAEGIVARPRIELKARNGDRIITKIKHRDFRSN
jgi:hypothetical protein